MASFEDFDRHVAADGIPEEHYPAAFALWISQHMGGGYRGSRRSSGSHRRTEL
jgi:hypothetical protein